MTKLEGTTVSMKMEYILDALLTGSELIENCAICSFKDRTMIKKAIHYAEELAILDKKYCDLNGDP